MNVDELVLKTRTDIIKENAQQDILHYYGVPMLIDKVVEKERISFLDSLGISAGIASEIKSLSPDGRFSVEIPLELREAFKTGDATFINSTKTPGHFTPNIKINGKDGIGGQITLSEDKIQVNEANLANIAVMAMVQSVLGKMEAIESKIDDIVQGQMNDRIGMVVGTFKGFADLYPTFKTQEELVANSNQAYQTMQSGLAQIHLDIDRDFDILKYAPGNFWQVVKNAIIHFRRNDAEYYQNIYRRLMYKLQIYQRLLLLSDAVLLLKGDKHSCQQNHKVMFDFCNDKLNKLFEKKMDFLTNHHSSEIKRVNANNTNYNKILDELDKVPITIEYKKEDLEKIKVYESKEC